MAFQPLVQTALLASFASFLTFSTIFPMGNGHTGYHDLLCNLILCHAGLLPCFFQFFRNHHLYDLLCMALVYPKTNPSVYQMVFTEPSIAVKKPLYHHFSRLFFIITMESGCQIPIFRQTAILDLSIPASIIIFKNSLYPPQERGGRSQVQIYGLIWSQFWSHFEKIRLF